MILAPRTYDNNHKFVNTTTFDEDENLEWNDLPIGILKHKDNNVKLFIDGSNDDNIKDWRRSFIRYDKIRIIADHVISLDTDIVHFGSYYNENNTSVKSRLEFNNGGRLITYKNGLGRKTLTKYDGSEKTNLPDEYKNKFSNYRYTSGRLLVDIHSFSQWGSASLNSLMPTENLKIGQLNDTVTIQFQLKDSNQEGVENAPIYFSVNQGQFQEVFHTHGLHSLTDENGYASCEVLLRNEGITKIVANVDSPTQFTGSTIEINCVTDETEVYIRNVKYETKGFSDDFKLVWNKVEAILTSINTISFTELGITQTNAVDSLNEEKEEMVVFLKNVKLNSQDYMTDFNAASLRSTLISKFNSAPNFSFSDIEVRTYRRFVNL